MKAVVTANEMQELDRQTIQELGIPGIVLMENAGRAVAAVIENEYGGGRVAVVAGQGNNGGDGFVIARVLRAAGREAELFLAADAGKITGDAAHHLGFYQRTGGTVIDISTPARLGAEAERICSAPVLCDALFGTGLAREVTGHLAEVIALCNQNRGAIISVDIPSGLCATTGRVLGCSIAARRTVTMACLKVGLAVAPGYARAGTVSVAEIGIAAPAQPALALLEESDIRALLQPMPVLAHKGSRGHVLVLAGSPGKRGAARLSALAALRSGAGLVTVCAEDVESDYGMPDPVMTKNLGPNLDDFLQSKAAVAIGPGMDTTAKGKMLVQAVLAEAAVPVVLDADALNHLGTDLSAVAARSAPTVLTPHPGEAARLLGCSTADIEADRVAAVRRLAERSRAVVVLKGARSLVADGRAVTINPSGTPAMATAGSGDVLTGCLAACLGTIAVADATRLAVYVHGRAGERAEARYGVRSVTASDLVVALAAAFRELEA